MENCFLSPQSFSFAGSRLSTYVMDNWHKNARFALTARQSCATIWSLLCSNDLNPVRSRGSGWLLRAVVPFFWGVFGNISKYKTIFNWSPEPINSLYLHILHVSFCPSHVIAGISNQNHAAIRLYDANAVDTKRRTLLDYMAPIASSIRDNMPIVE